MAAKLFIPLVVLASLLACDKSTDGTDDPTVCSGGSIYVEDGPQGAGCYCPEGTEPDGAICRELFDPCASDICDPARSTCVPDGDSYTCECLPGYAAGPGGGCAEIDECAAGNTCDPATSTCVDQIAGYVCECLAGFTEDGAGGCVEIDECATNPCDPGTSTCVDAIDGYTCACLPGFEEDGAGGCAEIDECAANPCDRSSSTCVDQLGGYVCACLPGFAEDGLGGCVEVDECAAGHACDPATSACVDQLGSYVCACLAGFAEDGSGGCVEIDECATNPCDPGTSTCVDAIDGYTCACFAGFEEDGAGGCAEIDECAANPCDRSSSTCVDQLGGYVCACLPGFAEDGLGGCVEVDECAAGHTCDPGSSVCVDGVGSYTCDCLQGFREDGAGGCVEIDECQPFNSCNPSMSTCVDLVGAYTCDCFDGYEDDGSGRGCRDINECDHPEIYGCLGICYNNSGSYECFGEGGVSSIADPNTPYPEVQCADITFNGRALAQIPTQLPADCRCTNQHFPICGRPFDTALVHTFGAGPKVVDHDNGEILGCATAWGTSEVLFGVAWGNSTDNRRGYVMAVDAESGDRRVVSGEYEDPRNGLVTVGAGTPFDTVVDVEIGPDGYLYVMEQSVPYNGFITENPPLQGVSIFRVDLATGDRTLWWNEREELPQFGHCGNGDPLGIPPTVIQIRNLEFAMDTTGNFYFNILENENPRPGKGFIRVSADGTQCDWVTRHGAQSGNLFFGQDIGTGADFSNTSIAGFAWKDDAIYTTDFISNRFIRISTVNGNRSNISSVQSPRLGEGPSNATEKVFFHDGLGAWVLHGLGGASYANLVDEVSGDRVRWTYQSGDGYPMVSPWETQYLNGPILGDGTTLHNRPFCISPTDPAYMIVATDAVGVVKVETLTGNSINFSL
jgi:hypothetical protein